MTNPPFYGTPEPSAHQAAAKRALVNVSRRGQLLEWCGTGGCVIVVILFDQSTHVWPTFVTKRCEAANNAFGFLPSAFGPPVSPLNTYGLTDFR